MENQSITVDNIEQLIKAMIEGYQESLPDDKWEVRYNITLTYHKVPTFQLSQQSDVALAGGKNNIDVAYLRLTRSARPTGGREEDWETHLIYHQSHQFKDMRERLNQNAPWKVQLYMDLLFRMTCAGLEYSELLRRLKNIKETGTRPDIVIPNTPEIIVTDKMPAPLTAQELEYKNWIDKNHDTTS